MCVSSEWCLELFPFQTIARLLLKMCPNYDSFLSLTVAIRVRLLSTPVFSELSHLSSWSAMIPGESVPNTLSNQRTAPQYLHALCVPVTASTSRRHLRSVDRSDLQVLACRTTTWTGSFAACAPKLWNNLPASFRDSTLTLKLFCSRLKTHLFVTAYTGVHSWLLRL